MTKSLRGSCLCGAAKFEVQGPIRGVGTCESPLPESTVGKRTWVQAGLMDDPIGTDMKTHIFRTSRADWGVESPDAKHFDGYPNNQ